MEMDLKRINSFIFYTNARLSNRILYFSLFYDQIRSLYDILNGPRLTLALSSPGWNVSGGIRAGCGV